MPSHRRFFYGVQDGSDQARRPGAVTGSCDFDRTIEAATCGCVLSVVLISIRSGRQLGEPTYCPVGCTWSAMASPVPPPTTFRGLPRGRRTTGVVGQVATVGAVSHKANRSRPRT